LHQKTNINNLTPLRYISLLLACFGLFACQTHPPFNDGDRWAVTYFWDRDEEKTLKFEGFAFEFRENGSLLAYHPNGLTYEGTWKGSASEVAFGITGTGTLDEMAETWDVISRSDTRLQLRDVNDITELYKEVILVQE
jgi:hypothetical protein